jgi:co-chaperonin GroES (HSP10)
LLIPNDVAQGGMKLRKQGNIFEIQTAGGIFIPYHLEPAPYTPQKGIVIQSPVPEFLPGDIVTMEYLDVLNALGKKFNRAAQIDDPKYFEDDDGIKILIRPKKIYFLQRGEELICVNGWNIIETIEEKVDTSLIIPDTAKKKSLIVNVVAGSPQFVGHQVFTRAMKGSTNWLLYFSIGDKKVIHEDNILAFAEYEEEKEEV